MDDELRTYLIAMEERIERRLDAMEGRLVRHIDKRFEEMVAKISAAFHSSASETDLRTQTRLAVRHVKAVEKWIDQFRNPEGPHPAAG